MSAVEVLFLHDGGQSADVFVSKLLLFIQGAQKSLDIALYDAHFSTGPDHAGTILDALNEAEARGVLVRCVYNDDDGPEGSHPFTVEPRTGPSFLARLAKTVPAVGVDGRYDLMHHKYVVRDNAQRTSASVWTGSANWTTDAFTRMENVVVTVDDVGLAAAYTRDFEDLWRRRKPDDTGSFDDDMSRIRTTDGPLTVRAVFSPGRGRAMSQLIATRLGEATERIRVCSPVITSTPILGTLAEIISDGNMDAKVTVDGTQMAGVIAQWQRDGRAAWKVPLYKAMVRSGKVAAKQSIPWGTADSYDFMHAKIVVCDDVVITGSFNCSHSGERNAENVVEIRNAAFADKCAAFCDEVYARYIGGNPGVN